MTLALVELVGPGGSGKSTLVDCIEQRGSARVVRVAYRKRAGSILRGMARALRHGGRTLSFRGLANLSRNCAAVEEAMTTVCRQSGFVLVDEGPLRVMRDELCVEPAELEAWVRYCNETLARLASLGAPLVLVEVAIDEDLRRERLRLRSARREERSRGVRAAMGRWLDHRIRGSRPLIDTAPTIDALFDRAEAIHRERLNLVDDALRDPDVAADKLEQSILLPMLGRSGERVGP